MSLLIFTSIFVIAIKGSVSVEGTVNGVKVPIYSMVYNGCFYIRNFGIECPTCGLTRGFYAFFDGKIALAIAYNYMVIPIVSLMTLIMVYNIQCLFFDKESTILRRVILANIIIFLVLFVFESIKMVLKVS